MPHNLETFCSCTLNAEGDEEILHDENPRNSTITILKKLSELNLVKILFQFFMDVT